MEKLARICWNTEGWKKPSGNFGKSIVGSSYKHNSGFGYEEWLFDTSKTIDGYHYGFLQAMTVRRHQNKIYDIHLFAISPKMERIYLGCLKNAVVVSSRESKDIAKIYMKNGWIKEMEEDIANVGGKPRNWLKERMFNVKFKFSEAMIYYSNPKLLNSNCIGHKYHLMNLRSELKFITDENGNNLTLDTRHIVSYDKYGNIMDDPIHRKMLDSIYDLLYNQYIYVDKDKMDADCINHKIDIVVHNSKTDERYYFEIKTTSARNSIRESLGLILEYAHYPSENRANKLFIVSPEQPDEMDKAYLNKLRSQYNIPVWFRYYSFEENKLYDAI